jgi:hypothetical protein
MQRCASAISSRKVRPIGIEATVIVIPHNSDTNIWLLPYRYENAAALSTGGALNIDALDLR